MPWLIEWTDETGNPDYTIREVAATADDAAVAVRRILTGSTWTPHESDEVGGPETVPAIEPPALAPRLYSARPELSSPHRPVPG